jgi:hypothetical protein
LKTGSRLHSLDMTLQLTRGNPTSFLNLIAAGSPAFDTTTVVCDREDGTSKMMCQVSHQIASQSAQLYYLIAGEDADPGDLACLLENLVQEAGQWGAMNLTCELESNSPFFETFRRADFNVWANERFWTINGSTPINDPRVHQWRTWNSADVKAMRALYQNIIPRLFQSIEPLTRKSTLGMVLFSQDNALMGYADLVYGPKGIWVLPVIYPEWADDPQLMLDLLMALPNKGKRPVYFCIRSYQPWLEDTLTRMNAQASQEYVLMVKYMALRQKAESLLERRVLENGRAENSVPVAHARHKDAL